ncbi:hypothetical protein SPONN_598 [uncultured Candidatus Thioglobus sp.]|nr:hypothetical protein SPONN_598 [uncultured Candidatus Thioglobus sp.]
MKTVTMRVDDDTYATLKLAANGQKRNLSNFIEFATLQYVLSDQYADELEMQSILQDQTLMRNLSSGFEDLKAGDYSIV